MNVRLFSEILEFVSSLTSQYNQSKDSDYIITKTEEFKRFEENTSGLLKEHNEFSKNEHYLVVGEMLCQNIIEKVYSDTDNASDELPNTLTHALNVVCTHYIIHTWGHQG